MTGSLPPMDRGARLERTRAAMAEAGCDALVVTKLVNIAWLTGFTGSNATAVITAELSSRLVTALTELMLTFSFETTSTISRSSPSRSTARMRSETGKTLVGSLPQSSSMIRSRSSWLRIFGQERRWAVIPEPRVT